MRRFLIAAGLSLVLVASTALAAGPEVEEAIKDSYSRVVSVETDGPFVYVGLYPLDSERRDLLAQSLCFYARKASEDVKVLYIVDETFRPRRERRVIGEWNCDIPG